MLYDLLWLTPFIVGLIRAIELALDSGRTLAAAAWPPTDERIVRIMQGNLRRDRFRIGMWSLYLLAIVAAPVLTAWLPEWIRIPFRNSCILGAAVFLFAAGESDKRERNALYKHHRIETEVAFRDKALK